MILVIILDFRQGEGWGVGFEALGENGRLGLKRFFFGVFWVFWLGLESWKVIVFFAFGFGLEDY